MASTALFGGIIELAPDGQPVTPEIVLAYRSGTKQGVIQNAAAFTIANHLSNADEVSFDVHKSVDGSTCDLWDELKDFKLVYIPHFETAKHNPWYEVTVTIDENDETVKHCEGVHLQEAELSQLTMNGVEINTENDIARDDYIATVIYNPEKPEGSLLHRILKDKASHYEIQHVDSSLANMQRTFSWNGTTIKDAFDEIATEIECLFVYGEGSSADGKIHRTISLYDLNDVCMECGERGSFTDKSCPKCGSTNIKYGYGTDTGIFINYENFADSITYSSNKDNVKNCFRLVAGDDLMTATVRNINPSGSQYLWYLSDEVRAEMSLALRSKLANYDTLYASYRDTAEIGVSEDVVTAYNTLVNKYKSYDNTLENITYPITGYSSLIDFYYQALNLYNLLKTTLAPASAKGTPTTAAQEAAKLTSTLLSPLGMQNADSASATTVAMAVANYAKVYIDTSLYRVTSTTISYNGATESQGLGKADLKWKGTLTVSSYSDDSDTATTSELSITITNVTTDFLKCQLEKAMKKNGADATGTVELFQMGEDDFKAQLSYYSVDNLNILANIARGCLDVLIQQGVADNSVSSYVELYNTIYLPYYNKSEWIQDELREREAEILVLRGTKTYPTGVLDQIEKQRSTIAALLDLRSYLGDILWGEFCSFRRDDDYQNDNFISDGLTDTELVAMAEEFYERAERELVKAATLQHTISCNLGNFLLLQDDLGTTSASTQSLTDIKVVSANNQYRVLSNVEFSPLLFNFDAGNWLRLEIDEKIYKLRLTDYQINYDDLSNLDVDFSDVTYGLGYLSDAQSILSKAGSMATSYPTTIRQADKGNKANQQITDMVENGLYLTNKKIVNAADNQDLVIDESGMLMREKNEFGDDYSDEQTKIINHGFYYTNDNWRTVQTGLGKFIYYDPESGTYKEDYGLIARKIVGNIILGNELGIYNTSGSVKIDENGFTITAGAEDTNKDLFTLQKENEDGTYTKYIYVDDDGNIKINGGSIQMTVNDTLESYIDNAMDTVEGAVTEKVGDAIDSVSGEVSATNDKIYDLSQQVTANASTFQQFADSISATIISTMLASGEWDGLLQQMTAIKATADGLNVDVSSITNNLDGFMTEYHTYFTATSEGLRISKSGSQFATLLSDTKLSFIQAGQEVAYIQYNRLYITEAWVKSGLSIESASGGSYIRQYVDSNNVFCIQSMEVTG